jgi:hypothetical protein
LTVQETELNVSTTNSLLESGLLNGKNHKNPELLEMKTAFCLSRLRNNIEGCAGRNCAKVQCHSSRAFK